TRASCIGGIVRGLFVAPALPIMRRNPEQDNRMSRPDLSERKQRLLMALVERHIRDGQPVGSKTLAEGTGLSVSPATIRNIMAELEDIGVLSSPHTSAGRVPTEVGYRLYRSEERRVGKECRCRRGAYK